MHSQMPQTISSFSWSRFSRWWVVLVPLRCFPFNKRNRIRFCYQDCWYLSSGILSSTRHPPYWYIILRILLRIQDDHIHKPCSWSLVFLVIDAFYETILKIRWVSWLEMIENGVECVYLRFLWVNNKDGRGSSWGDWNKCLYWAIGCKYILVIGIYWSEYVQVSWVFSTDYIYW